MPRNVQSSVNAGRERLPVPSANASSWLALVAATTFGFGAVDCFRAEVSAAQDLPTDGSFRLVVQSYGFEELDAQGLPGRAVRPLGSAQRAITADELRRGVAVEVVQIDDGVRSAGRRARVVAWVEPGQPDLEFDAMTARPSSDAVYGISELRNGSSEDLAMASSARVVLSRRPGQTA